MNRHLKRVLIVLCLTLVSVSARCQTAVKSNLIDDAMLDINVGIEKTFKPKWTFEAVGSLNAWTLSDGKRWKHWWVQPGVRYWLCDAYDGHFFGIHGHGGQYNVGGLSGMPDFLGSHFSRLADQRYQGWFVGAGISYGYAWILNRHWNIEAEIGFGWAYTRYDQYPCAHCGSKTAQGRNHNYVGPTKAAVNLVYIF